LYKNKWIFFTIIEGFLKYICKGFCDHWDKLQIFKRQMAYTDEKPTKLWIMDQEVDGHRVKILQDVELFSIDLPKSKPKLLIQLRIHLEYSQTSNNEHNDEL